MTLSVSSTSLKYNFSMNNRPVALKFDTRVKYQKLHEIFSHCGFPGEKPFLCEECGQTFTQSGSRNVHMRRNHSKVPGLLTTLSASLVHPITTATNTTTFTPMETTDLQPVAIATRADGESEAIAKGLSDAHRSDLMLGNGSTNAADLDRSTVILVKGDQSSIQYTGKLLCYKTPVNYSVTKHR